MHEVMSYFSIGASLVGENIADLAALEIPIGVKFNQLSAVRRNFRHVQTKELWD